MMKALPRRTRTPRPRPPASTRHAVASAIALLGLAYGFAAQATDVAKKPVRGALLVEPNIVFVYDDSGSMDAEILLDTTEGALWWNGDAETGWNRTGSSNAPFDQLIPGNTYQYRKLFPQLDSPTNASAGTETNPNLYRAAPPIAQLAWLRSNAFNRLYYNPMVTYAPWSPAILSGPDGTLYTPQVTTSYADANTAQTLTHPSTVLHTSGLNTYSLFTTAPAAADGDEAFSFGKGMIYSPGARPSNGSSFTGLPLPGGTAQPGLGLQWYGVPYYPATYWHPEACTPPASAPTPYAEPNCVNRPDGAGTLKRYEVKPGVTFPSGRTYAQEQQNFANWWQYHRKRRLMTSAVMGKLVNGLGEGLRVGHLYLNTAVSGTASPPLHADITLESTTTTPTHDGDAVRKRLAGRFYNRTWVGGAPTPTRKAMTHVFNQFDTNPNLIQHACQRNYQLIITDGYATDAGAQGHPLDVPPPPPALPPLRPVAKQAYETRLRAAGTTALPAGQVPTGDPGRPNPDVNANLHLNTYAISLGLSGLSWPANDANGDNVPDTTQTWPAGEFRGRPKIDDLWGATVEGKGLMLKANDAEGLTQALGQIMFDITSVLGTQGAASFSSVNLSGNDFALLASYNAGRWNGDLTRRTVDAATGNVGTTDIWSTAGRLDDPAVTPASRVLFTQNGPFTASIVGASINPGNAFGSANDVVAYLRGDRSKEGFGSGQFRPRKSRLGAIANSVPAMTQARTVAFVASSDGFLHAINLSDGRELWGYAPQAALSKLGASTQLNWGFEALHDGSPVVAKVGGSTEMLFGSVGSSQKGWYALDVSNATAVLNETQRAATVRWELPGANATLQGQMGTAAGRPILVKTAAWGEVLLLTSGYNASSPSGKGRLFVVRPTDGTILATAETPAVAAANVDPGLAQVSAFREVDGTVRYVFGGDELGNLWRFDLSTTSPVVTRVAVLKDTGGLAQRIATRPALVEYQGQRIVMVGTGALLGASDLAAESRGNTFYAIRDTGSELIAPRNASTGLVKQTLAVDDAAGTRSIASPAPVDWSARRGWYIDLPADERANIAPLVGIAAVAFVTNRPQGNPCSMASYRYALDIASGAALDDPAHPGLVSTALTSTQGSAGNSIVVTAGTPVGGGTSGGSRVCIRGLDGTLECHDFEKGDVYKPRKAGWRRVIR
jgi:type IV pilus assembly protein PilY1